MMSNDNFYYQIKNIEYWTDAIIPSHLPNDYLFRSINDSPTSDASVLRARQYSVDYIEESEPLNITDGFIRTTRALFRIAVYYPREGVAPEYNYRMALRDRRDIQRQLESQLTWVGISSTQSSLDIGLRNRHVSGIQLYQDDPAYWTLEISITCIIEES
jgi:hypothetical protein